jgi:hypothetical protein
MKIIELRDKLNKLIEEGKGYYVVYEEEQEVIEVEQIIEGFVVEEEGYWGNFQRFHNYEDIENKTYGEEYRQGIKKESERTDKINGIKFSFI